MQRKPGACVGLASIGLSFLLTVGSALPGLPVTVDVSSLDPARPETILSALGPVLPTDAEEQIARAIREAKTAKELGHSLVATSSIASSLARAQGMAGLPLATPASSPEFASLSDALAGLAAASGLDAAGLSLEEADRLLPPELSAVVVDLIEQLIVSIQLRDLAFASLDAAERAAIEELAVSLRASPWEAPLLLAGVLSTATPAAPEVDSPDDPVQAVGWEPVTASSLGIGNVQLGEVAGKVNLAALATAGVVAMQAIDQAIPQLQALEGLFPQMMPAVPGVSQVPGIPVTAGAPGPPCPLGVICLGPAPTPEEECPAYYAPAITIGPLLSLGGPMPNAHTWSVILSLDLGASPDCYLNNAGGNLWVGAPLAISLDLGGADSYHGPNPYAPAGAYPIGGASTQFEFGIQGSGFFGIGALVDVSGPDSYNSYENLRAFGASPSCSATPYAGAIGPAVGFGSFFNQGASLLGVGVIADLGGMDAYNSYSDLCRSGEAFADPVDFTVSFSQGAAQGGIALLLDAGAEYDAYNSHNRLSSYLGSFGDDNVFTVDHGQGWAGGLGGPLGALPIPGIGVFVEETGDNAYNSYNDLDVTNTDPIFSATSIYSVLCIQGVAGFCKQQHGGGVFTTGIGVMVDAAGGDKYNCHNHLVGTLQSGFGSDWDAFVVQGAVLNAGPGIGILADLLGDDCYNSVNVLMGCEPTYGVDVAQGATFDVFGGLIQIGVHAEPSGTDVYNGANELTATAPFFTDLDVTNAQGAAVGGFLALAVLADLSLLGGDSYNSENFQLLPGPSVFQTATISGVQGYATGFGALSVGVMLEADLASTDLYNSFNTLVDAAYVPTGDLGITFAEGTTAGGGPFPFLFGILVDVGGSNFYNDENAPDAAPAPLGLAYTAVHGVAVPSFLAGGAGIAVFADLSVGVPAPPILDWDHYAGGGGVDLPPAAPAFGTPLGDGFCVDAVDFPGDVPFAFSVLAGGGCIDL